MNLGLKDTHWYADIKEAYGAARRSNAYNLESYCMENADGASGRVESLRARMYPNHSHMMDCHDPRLSIRRILGRDDAGLVWCHPSARRHVGYHKPAAVDGARSTACRDHDWCVRRLPMRVDLASERWVWSEESGACT
jgi:hypothetical protein